MSRRSMGAGVVCTKCTEYGEKDWDLETDGYVNVWGEGKYVKITVVEQRKWLTSLQKLYSPVPNPRWCREFVQSSQWVCGSQA